MLDVRARILVVAPISLVIGCSLVVDTSGLSTASESVPGSSDGGAAAETSTTGGDGSMGFSGDASGDGPTNGCPSGRGPSMIRVTDPNGAFCIDSTEVTQTQFNAFLADSARPTPPKECAYRTAYGGATRPTDTFPVVDVDWCEAWMFCAWAGKRLCGSRNGKVIDDYAPANDPKVSEWFVACSHSGSTKYPYGDTADKNACQGCDRTNTCGSAAPLVPVGSLPKCEGGYPGIFDMTGNVGEWEDNCQVKGTAPETDECPPRGRDTTLAASNMTCAITEMPFFKHRQDRNAVTGIRCCAD